MNKDQFARLQRHRKVKKTLADFALAVASVPAFAKLAAKYLAQLKMLDGAAQRNPRHLGRGNAGQIAGWRGPHQAADEGR